MNRLLRFSIIVCAYLCALAPCGSGEEGTTVPSEPFSKILELSLEDALEIGVINNFDIQIAELENRIEDTDLGRTISIYDALLTAEVTYDHEELEKTSTLAGTVAEDYEASAGISKMFPTGTDVTLDYTYARSRSDSAFTQLNPSEESSFTVSFVQPVLKNILGINDRRDIAVTKIEIGNFRSETIDKMEKILSDIEMAYWNLALRQDVTEIRTKLYDKAEDFYKLVEKKEELGSAEKTDLYAARANLKVRNSELILERSLLGSAENRINFLLNNGEGAGNIVVRAAERIDIKAERISLENALKTAFENRRDYRRASSDIRAGELTLAMEENDMWPEVDLEGSFTINGVRRSFASSLEDMTNETNTEYYAGVSFSYPVENNEALADLKKAEYEKAKALVNLKRIEKEILSQIDSRVRSVNAHRVRAADYLKVAELQRLKLEEEEKKYRYGRSDSDRIVRFQDDYLNAELAACRAKMDYAEELTGLYLAQNSYLERRGLAVD